MTYKLMIKTHNLTGLKYLCITKRANWQDYLGSGTRWNRHLKKHGNDISTELLFESDDYSTFVEVCYYYSDLFDVAKHKLSCYNFGYKLVLIQKAYKSEYY